MANNNGRDDKGRFIKGNPQAKKRPPNKTTRQTKEIVSQLVSDEFNAGNVHDALDKLSQSDPGKYLDIVTKLMAFVLPKMKSVENVGEPPVIIELPHMKIDELRQIAYDEPGAGN